MSQPLTSTPHPLKDKWFFFYQKAGFPRGSFEMIEGDYITTIEEAFAALKALPDVSLLPQGDGIFISRNKIEPKFESFPNGYRIRMFTRSKIHLDTMVPRVIASALGESILKGFEDFPEPKPRVGVIRMNHKPHRVYPESCSIDLWFPANPYQKEVLQFFEELGKPAAGIIVNLHGMSLGDA